MNFNLNVSSLLKTLLPPMLRQPSQVGWMNSLAIPMQYDHDRLFHDFISGSSIYAFYNNATSYVGGDKIVYINRGVYESISGSTGVLPTDITKWNQYLPNYIGAIERSEYSAQKYLYEYALNRWFEVSGITTSTVFSSANTNIYITTNVASSQRFVLGNTGPYSSDLNNISSNAMAFMGNTYVVPTFNDYTIWVPTYVTTTLTDVRAFSDMVNISGMQYNVVNY